jgi:hypothetical protein
LPEAASRWGEGVRSPGVDELVDTSFGQLDQEIAGAAPKEQPQQNSSARATTGAE